MARVLDALRKCIKDLVSFYDDSRLISIPQGAPIANFGRASGPGASGSQIEVPPPLSMCPKTAAAAGVPVPYGV